MNKLAERIPVIEAPAVMTLAEDAPEFSHEIVDHGVHYMTTQHGVRLSCPQVEKLLTGPLRDNDAIYDTQPYLHKGLQAYTYPNSDLNKRAANMSKHVQTGLRQMAPDIKRLVSMLKADAKLGETILPIRVANDEQAGSYAREHLVTMKPSRLTLLCQQLGISVNELGLWRKKRGDRHNREIRMYHLDELGADSEQLKDKLVDRLFKRINLLRESGVEVALVPRQDIASPGWLQGVTIGELKRPLLPKDDWLPRWEVAFREGSIARREIVPVIGWSAVGENHWPYDQRRTRIDFRGGGLRFDEQTRRLTQYSPALGAVMLSCHIELPDDIRRQAYQFFGRSYDQYGNGQRLPRNAIAALPAILTKREYSDALTATVAFKAVEAQFRPAVDSLCPVEGV